MCHLLNIILLCINSFSKQNRIAANILQIIKQNTLLLQSNQIESVPNRKFVTQQLHAVSLFHCFSLLVFEVTWLNCYRFNFQTNTTVYQLLRNFAIQSQSTFCFISFQFTGENLVQEFPKKVETIEVPTAPNECWNAVMRQYVSPIL